MNENSENQKTSRILERIHRSGFPLEIEIGNMLRKSNWIVRNQWPYIDRITRKVRTIDVFAWRFWPQFELSFLLLLECKKSSRKEWVFYTQRKGEEITAELAAIIEFDRKLENTPAGDKLLAKLSNMSYDKIRKSPLSALSVLDKSVKIGVLNMGSGKQDFHIATQQIMSATEVASEGMKLCCTYPVIVFDGELFEFFEEEEEKLLLVSHLQYPAFWQRAWLIDVVKKKYFSDFLGRIEHDSLILSNFLTKGCAEQ